MSRKRRLYFREVQDTEARLKNKSAKSESKGKHNKSVLSGLVSSDESGALEAQNDVSTNEVNNSAALIPPNDNDIFLCLALRYGTVTKAVLDLWEKNIKSRRLPIELITDVSQHQASDFSVLILDETITMTKLLEKTSWTSLPGPESLVIVNTNWLIESFKKAKVLSPLLYLHKFHTQCTGDTGKPLETRQLNHSMKLPNTSEHSATTATAAMEGDTTTRPRYESGKPVPDREKFACQISGTDKSANLNQALTDQLEKLGSVYSTRKLKQTNDKHKAQAYVKVVTKLKALDFKVTSIDQVKHFKGFGKSILDVIGEILDCGESSKIAAYEADWRTQAAVALCKIHGVGPENAKKLIAAGITDISSARKNVGVYPFDSRMLVGIKHYEDFQVKIPRDEVARIEGFVCANVQALVPGAFAQAVGSFRRGKAYSGDIDIIIAPPQGQAQVLVMKELLKRLSDSGFLTDHLAGYEEEHISSPKASYMGVCRELDRPDAIFRRIDIKVYPRALFAFALLHFTGSGHFNRSMRTYCQSYSLDGGKHFLTLSDEGLMPCTRQSVNGKTAVTWKGQSINCATERDIFKVLNLVYKEPAERDVYGAVPIETRDNKIVMFEPESCSDDDEQF